MEFKRESVTLSRRMAYISREFRGTAESNIFQKRELLFQDSGDILTGSEGQLLF
jgi:hypothetical protein